MNPLRIESKTGYHESSNSEYTFNAQKKSDFIRLAREIVEAHEYPNVGDLCKVLDISVRTFQNHLEIDEKFAADWRELELKGEATCLSDMYAMRKKNPMYMFGWLRARLPEKYDTTKRVELTSDFSSIKRLADALSTVNRPVVATDAVITSSDI